MARALESSPAAQPEPRTQPSGIETRPSAAPEPRFASLDFFRGLTMFLLIAESTRIYENLVDPALQGSVVHAIGTQFHHHPWNGLRFWDLIQPFFMFIVGVAMPFSFGRRWDRGDSWAVTFRHAGFRSLLLFLFGVGLYCIGPGRPTFELWNVLTQLSFTYLVAFLVMRQPAWQQITLGFLMIGASELLYRTFSVPGFDQPFVPDKNFGSYVDLLLMGKLSGGHWVAFNAVPTAAHTIWGVVAGQLLRSDRPAARKIRILALAGLAGVAVGYALDPITPIIKRICTSSFVIVSGGWCLLALAFSYWLIDVKKVERWSRFAMFVGMNSLFIYLFTNTGGGGWLIRIVRPFTTGAFGWAGELSARIATSLAVWALLWYICYWLYRRRIFFKI